VGRIFTISEVMRLGRKKIGPGERV